MAYPIGTKTIKTPLTQTKTFELSKAERKVIDIALQNYLDALYDDPPDRGCDSQIKIIEGLMSKVIGRKVRPMTPMR